MSRDHNGQIIETAILLSGSATLTGIIHDMAHSGRFSTSLFIERDSADTDVDLIVETAHDGDQPSPNWRQVDLVNHAVTAGTPTVYAEKIFRPGRRWIRLTLINKTANDFLETELILNKMGS